MVEAFGGDLSETGLSPDMAIHVTLEHVMGSSLDFRSAGKMNRIVYFDVHER